MGTMIKRKGAYRFTVSLGYDTQGKQIRKTMTFTPPESVTPNKANKLAKEALYEFEQRCRGFASLNENMRFLELAEWYFEYYAPNKLKEITAYNYKSQLYYHIIPEIGNLKLKDIATSRITALFSKLGLSATTSRKVYTIVQSVLRRAVEQGFIRESPCRNVILPKDKTPKEKKRFLDENDAKELLEMAKEQSQFNTIIKTLLYTGMRSGECLGLRWIDIDFDAKVIHVGHTLTDVGGKHWLTEPKTKNSDRYISMSETMVLILKEHCVRQKEKKLKLGKIYFQPDMVFTSDTGNYLDRSRLNLQFRRMLKGTHLDFLTLHGLRHCNATLLINSGFDIKLVSDHLGHSDISTTANIYTDVLASSKAKMAEVLALKLGE